VKCPSCGTENREEARFCRRCGAAMAEAVPVEMLAAEAGTPGDVVAEAGLEPDEPSGDAIDDAVAVEVGMEDGAAGGEALAEAGVAGEDTEELGEETGMSAEAEPAENEAEGGVPEEPGVPEEEEDAGVPEEAVEFSRETGQPLEPVPAGTVIDGRYAVVEPVDVQEHEILYRAQDLQRCPQCGYEGNAPSEAFCARCGAVLDHKPQVRLLQVVDAEAAPAGGEAVSVRLEAEGRHFLILAEPQPPGAAAAEQGATRLVTGQRSIPGQVRELNEDSVLVLTLIPIFESQVQPMVGLFAVADGMGGHEGGEIASKLALQVLAGELLPGLLLPALREAQPDAMSEQVLLDRLRQAVDAANDAVYLARNKRSSDMGTTLTVLLAWGRRLLVAHVGDCRAFRWNASGLDQLTTDHSVVATMVANGRLAADEIYTHPHRSVIYRSIGDKPTVEVDTGAWPLAAGDRLIVCSDGLWEMIRNEGIEEGLLAEADPQAACELLAGRANAAGGEDNISVVVVQVET